MRHERDWPVLEAVRPERLFHYAGTISSPGCYYAFVPADADPTTPVLVAVHGISRNAAEHLFRLSPLAREGRFALVVPVFDKSTYGQYQQLSDASKAGRADEALLDMLDDFGRRTQIDVARIALTGFSGGAQFAHRFAMVNADRVAFCLPCSAGWYSFPETDLAFPEGLGGLSVHPNWESVPVHVLVGKDDTRRDPSLKSTPSIDVHQGRNRLTRARRWTKALQRHRASSGYAGAVQLTEISGVGHDFADLAITTKFASAIADAVAALQGI